MIIKSITCNLCIFTVSKTGPDLKLGRGWALVDRISLLVTERHYSPYAIIQHFHANEWPSGIRICEKTLYSYIAAGDITGISEDDLLLGGRRCKPRKKPSRHSRAANATRSIDKRPKEINERSRVGHWEIDTAYSGKDSRCGMRSWHSHESLWVHCTSVRSQAP